MNLSDNTSDSQSEVPYSLNQAIEYLIRPIEAWKKEIKIEKFQGKGPGGQKRNRVYSGIRAIHKNGVIVEAVTHREVSRNEQEAYQKIILETAWLLADKVNEGFEIMAETLKKFKGHRISESNELYPAFCCFSKACLLKDEGKVQFAVKHSGWTTSALIRQWSRDKKSWTQVNSIRISYNKSPFKC